MKKDGTNIAVARIDRGCRRMPRGLNTFVLVSSKLNVRRKSLARCCIAGPISPFAVGFSQLTAQALGKHGVHAFDDRSGQKRPCNQLQEKYSSDSSVVGPVSEGSVNTRMHEHLRGRWQQHPARADDLEHFKVLKPAHFYVF